MNKVIRNNKVIKDEFNKDLVLPNYIEKNEEVRAIWISTVYNIDLSVMKDIDSYKKEIIGLLDNIYELNFNTIFFQVRSMNDAFYPSKFAPFSRFITGKEGVDPGFDILEFVIEEAHKRDISVHAWLNPYRVSSNDLSIDEHLKILDDKNFAKNNPHLLIQDNKNGITLNPGEEKVRQYIYDIIDELLNNYDLEGIHFDDYFYSYHGIKNFDDESTYIKNKIKGESLGDFRRRSVDELIKNIGIQIKKYNKENNKNIKYGISPFAVWRNKETDPKGSNTKNLQSYDSQYADSRKWVKEEYIDYILPQVYWPFDNYNEKNEAISPYADVVKWWSDVCDGTNVDLIIGHGFFNYTNKDSNWISEFELQEQLRYNQNYSNIIGSSIFAYNTFLKDDEVIKKSIKDLKENYWTKKVKSLI